jgi:hypothetical protein
MNATVIHRIIAINAPPIPKRKLLKYIRHLAPLFKMAYSRAVHPLGIPRRFAGACSDSRASIGVAAGADGVITNRGLRCSSTLIT